ncbi:hypothetical protein NPIL_549311 [Nephila pilipes]|uniref:Uncharacterized protein n=1 Tax=Nephila pilipes TaxID=299642 RepID=A0A8X6Q222_NEPPI|nr:hypothetical protein NPIL_549311 [Nephila pilipes]
MGERGVRVDLESFAYPSFCPDPSPQRFYFTSVTRELRELTANFTIKNNLKKKNKEELHHLQNRKAEDGFLMTHRLTSPEYVCVYTAGYQEQKEREKEKKGDFRLSSQATRVGSLGKREKGGRGGGEYVASVLADDNVRIDDAPSTFNFDSKPQPLTLLLSTFTGIYALGNLIPVPPVPWGRHRPRIGKDGGRNFRRGISFILGVQKWYVCVRVRRMKNSGGPLMN